MQAAEERKCNLKDLTLPELEDFVLALGEPKFRAKQIFAWLYKGVRSFSEMTNLSKPLRERLARCASVGALEIEQKFISHIDETRRYLLKLGDGNYIESVLMRYHHGYTICVSSQVGCAMGCSFCASTRAGKIRSLSCGEILDQIVTVQRDLGERISNIVMMGIGEPLDNYDAVLKFLRIVQDKNGLYIGHRHITLSTCGLADRIRDLAEEELQITLSVSLHAAEDAQRSALMPVNRRYPIAAVLDACRYYIEKTNRRVSFEYTLIQGVNDTDRDAERLAALLRGLLCHVNLIPVNEVRESGFRASVRERVCRFQQRLEAAGISATVRREMGADIQAACGQLRYQKIAASET